MTQDAEALAGGNVLAIASAVAKLNAAFPLDGDHFRDLERQGPGLGASDDQHQPGAHAAHFTGTEGAPGVQTFQGRLPPGKDLQLTADRPHRYGIEFLATGARVEFVMLAGQSCTIKAGGSAVKITMDDIEVPERGLQLVPAPLKEQDENRG